VLSYTVVLVFHLLLDDEFIMIQDWPQDIGGKSFSYIENMPAFVLLCLR
jgi:hypothetical protein